MIASYVVATSIDPRIYHGNSVNLAQRMYERELRKPGISSVVLYKLAGGQRRILRAAGDGVKIDTVVRCPICLHRTFVCRELCEREGFPVCVGGGGATLSVPPRKGPAHAEVRMEPITGL